MCSASHLPATPLVVSGIALPTQLTMYSCSCPSLQLSLRTVPRNFPGRSGTQKDQVYLCSPETAAVSALLGAIADPRDGAQELGIAPPRVREPDEPARDGELLVAPLPPEEAARVELVKGPGITSLPALEPFDRAVEAPVLLALGDDVSTDEILPAGARVLPYRSDIARIADFSFEPRGLQTWRLREDEVFG